MSPPEDDLKIGLGYPLEQLAKALLRDEPQAKTRVEKWKRVLAGMLAGTLDVGSRTPVAQTPPWVTLEVAHGGFATGRFAAGGPLQSHEVEKLAELGAVAEETRRASLNLHFLRDEGRGELASRLRDGLFRAYVPEETALLVVTWLADRGEIGRAEAVLGAIAPFFDRLRFYPVPHPQPPRTSFGVYLETVEQTAKRLHAARPQQSLAAMREAIEVWAPLSDRAVALFVETVEGDPPALRTDASGALVRRPSGHPVSTEDGPASASRAIGTIARGRSSRTTKPRVERTRSAESHIAPKRTSRGCGDSPRSASRIAHRSRAVTWVQSARSLPPAPPRTACPAATASKPRGPRNERTGESPRTTSSRASSPAGSRASRRTRARPRSTPCSARSRPRKERPAVSTARRSPRKSPRRRFGASKLPSKFSSSEGSSARANPWRASSRS